MSNRQVVSPVPWVQTTVQNMVPTNYVYIIYITGYRIQAQGRRYMVKQQQGSEYKYYIYSHDDYIRFVDD